MSFPQAMVEAGLLLLWLAGILLWVVGFVFLTSLKKPWPWLLVPYVWLTMSVAAWLLKDGPS